MFDTVSVVTGGGVAVRAFVIATGTVAMETDRCMALGARVCEGTRLFNELEVGVVFIAVAIAS